MTTTSSSRRTPRGAIVFDLDGTLVDTSGDIVAAVNHVREMHSLSALDARAVLDEVGLGAAHLISRTIGIAKDASGFDAALGAFRAYYKNHQGTCSEAYPGVRDMLSALVGELDLYVLSNKPHEATVREIGIQGLSGFFRDIFGGGRFPALKPDPAGVLEALRASGLDPSRGAMVGDLIVDMQTGANAGVSLFLVTWGFARPLVGFEAKHATAATPAELVQKITRAFTSF
jgi:phosphoglycolate phosphatase-like HAD superfamily hydrolase